MHLPFLCLTGKGSILVNFKVTFPKMNKIEIFLECHKMILTIILIQNKIISVKAIMKFVIN